MVGSAAQRYFAISKVGVQYRQRRLGSSAMVFGNHRLDSHWKKFPFAELNAVAAKDGREQDIDVPVQPIPHNLACCRIGAPETDRASRPNCSTKAADWL